jgi:AcrR family transcriptional regulator
MGSSRTQIPPARAAYHHGHLREAVLEAGLAHLEKSGDEALSLRELARQTGVAANAVYRHFASKERLLVALAAEGLRRLGAAQHGAMRDARDPIQAMKLSGLAYIRFARANPALFRLMFDRFANSQRDPELAQAVRESFEQLCAAVAAASKLGIADPRVSVRAIHALALVHGLSHLHLDGQLADWVGDADALTESVLQYASQLRAPRKSG